MLMMAPAMRGESMIDFGFQNGKALLNHMLLMRRGGRIGIPLQQNRDLSREPTEGVKVIPFMINNLDLGAQRETDFLV